MDGLYDAGKKTIPHTKMLPQCRNVTKQNCVTLWETDPNGKQVILVYFYLILPYLSYFVHVLF